MPSRSPVPELLLSPAALPPLLHVNRHQHHFHHLDLIITLLSITFLLSVFTFAFVLFHFLSRRHNATAPSDLKPPHRYSFSLLRRATSSFSTSNRLGQGGFGSVYKGILPTGKSVAVKVMDSGALQGEREFNNELSLASRIENSTQVLPILGYSSDSKRQRLVLVYELMSNGSLQDALLHRKPLELMVWKVRFDIVKDVVDGIYFLHHLCDPPVIHGDIKPSNVLLDCDFRAKISDFGLARVRNDDDIHVVEVVAEDGDVVAADVKPNKKRKAGEKVREDNQSIMEETESVVTVIEEGMCDGIDDDEGVLSPENVKDVAWREACPSETLEKGSVSEGYFDKFSVDSGKDLMTGSVSKKFAPKKSLSGRDWWWKQDNNGGSESGRVKDYVMEWIGNEIKERPKREWSSKSTLAEASTSKSKEKKKGRKRMEWWKLYDDQKLKNKEKVRKPREWWKEEFCEELSNKGNKKRSSRSFSYGNGDEGGTTSVTKKSKSKHSKSGVEWWPDSISGELRIGNRNSQDWTNCDIPKSGGISSTPSMRGTLCYIAPECSGGGQPSEKCDVYSFGVLLLVIVSGRRPLQVTASPMSEFERANLISWARQLAHNGKLLDLVDPNIQSLDREQALLCITIALLCLQRSPKKRPSMKDIAMMLSGEAEPPPHLPFEFSPSPPADFPFKSRRKHR